jgi:hypothetical protein
LDSEWAPAARGEEGDNGVDDVLRCYVYAERIFAKVVVYKASLERLKIGRCGTVEGLCSECQRGMLSALAIDDCK